MNSEYIVIIEKLGYPVFTAIATMSIALSLIQYIAKNADKQYQDHREDQKEFVKSLNKVTNVFEQKMVKSDLKDQAIIETQSRILNQITDIKKGQDQIMCHLGTKKHECKTR